MITCSSRIFIIALLILFFTGPNSGIAGETYKWVDKDGRIHFSDRAPDDHEAMPDIIRQNENDVKDTAQTAPEKSSETEKNPLEHTAESTFTIRGTNSVGTGFFISPEGYAITCKHVIEENGSHYAVLHNQEEYPIGVIAKSTEYDLALVLVATHQRTPYLELRDPFSIKPGEKVYAVGSSAGLQSTITDGLFTGLRKHVPTDKRVIQFSAPVNPGNSGGPLIDNNGKVIGAVSFKLLSNNGVPVTGIGFAVPSDYIADEYSGYMKK
ncbi:MAG: trypsin-like peptidase domain-containing protein [Deltaproteobacteria bacterium]|nr:trypsin-like peptidase domain-containing protein [Deltaproteobacteria bacterium]